MKYYFELFFVINKMNKLIFKYQIINIDYIDGIRKICNMINHSKSTYKDISIIAHYNNLFDNCIYLLCNNIIEKINIHYFNISLIGNCVKLYDKNSNVYNIYYNTVRHFNCHCISLEDFRYKKLF